MSKIQWIIITVVLLCAMIFGAFMHRIAHRCPVCPKCPELVARSHVERDSIVIHDTVRVVKYAPSITVISEPAADTTQRRVVTYKVVDTMPDKAVIGFSMASRDLPAFRPVDLTHTMWYVAKPDRIRIISDTLTVQLPPLPCPSFWKKGAVIGGTCFLLGTAAGGAAIYFLR